MTPANPKSPNKNHSNIITEIANNSFAVLKTLDDNGDKGLTINDGMSVGFLNEVQASISRSISVATEAIVIGSLTESDLAKYDMAVENYKSMVKEVEVTINDSINSEMIS